VSDILTRKADEVKEGIALLGKAAQVVPDAAKLCKAADTDIERLIQAVETFKNPMSFLYFVGKSILINHVEVTTEVEGAVCAYQAQNFTGLGYWVGRAMDTILLNQKTVPRDSKQDLLDFAQGFLQGISNASVFDDLKACISDSKDIYADIDNGIADIKTKVPDQVKQGIALLGEAAQLVPNAAQLCQVSVLDMDKLVKLIESFKSPESFLYYIGKSLLINHVEVIHEVESAVTAYDAHNYTTLGFWVGTAMDTILLGQPQEQDPKSNILDFTKGFLEGVGSSSIFDNITACLTDTEDFATEVDQGIDDIKTKQPDEVKKGIALLGQAAKMVPDAIQLCKVADADLDKLIKEVESFQSPESFLYYVGKSLLINHVEVIDEVENAINGYDAQNYTGFGYWVGKTMDTIFINQQNMVKDTKQEILDFTEGFLEGVGSDSIFNNITACLNYTDDFATEVDEGVKDIKTRQPDNVKKGIALLGQAAQMVPNAIQLCKVADADFDNLVKEIESFKNPKQFLYYVGKSLLINHVEVIHEMENAINGYNAQNYTGFGYWVGKTMDTIFVNQNETVRENELRRFRSFKYW